MVKSSLIRNVESTMWTMLLFKGWAVTILCQVFGCFFFLFWSKLTELLKVTFTSVTEHCSIPSSNNFCFVCFL